MNKVVIIGGGVSGMISAILASTNHSVTILEANDKCGKKILLTGNGKCNYWNQDITIQNYHSSDMDIVKKIITLENQKEVLDLLANIGIYPKIKNGYYYPYSNQASSVRNLLLLELERRKVAILYDFKVEEIVKKENGFLIKSKDQEICADQVILSTGSKACPKTGSDGSGYLLAESLGHTIHMISPALVQLIGKYTCFKEWDGVRCESKVSLYAGEEKVEEDTGEIQLTDYGISGIVTFNISGSASYYLANNKKVEARINFVPWLENTFYDFFTNRNQEIPNHTIEELLESIIPYKLMHVILKKASINKDDNWDHLTETKKQTLASYMENFPLEIVATNDYQKAQVCRGGVSLREINPFTMESTIVPNLYLVGELLDVDGRCGGFNMAFAFISGYLAGRSVK